MTTEQLKQRWIIVAYVLISFNLIQFLLGHIILILQFIWPWGWLVGRLWSEYDAWSLPIQLLISRGINIFLITALVIGLLKIKRSDASGLLLVKMITRIYLILLLVGIYIVQLGYVVSEI